MTPFCKQALYEKNEAKFLFVFNSALPHNQFPIDLAAHSWGGLQQDNLHKTTLANLSKRTETESLEPICARW